MTDAYFLYHSIGMYPGKDADLARALSDFAGVWGKADDSQWGYVLPLRARFIDPPAALAPSGFFYRQHIGMASDGSAAAPNDRRKKAHLKTDGLGFR